MPAGAGMAGQGRAWGGRYLLHNVAVAVAGSQVQWGVITTVHDVDARSPHDEHVDHIGAALAAGPVQGAEAMVIPAERGSEGSARWPQRVVASS